MPAVSQAQRGYLNARFGHAWVKKHHFDNAGKLPMYADAYKAKKPLKKPMPKGGLKKPMMSAKKCPKCGASMSGDDCPKCGYDADGD